MSEVALRLPPGVVLVQQEVPSPAARSGEHLAGRRSAAAALDRLGVTAPLPPDTGRTRFPPAVVGSVAHDAGTAVAVAARRSDGWASLGVDLHRPRPLTPEETRYLAGASELRRSATAVGPAAAPHLLFALKEAAFKAVSAQDGTWLEFADIQLAVQADGTARLLRPRRTGAVVRWGRSACGFTAVVMLVSPGRAPRGSA